MPTTFFFQGKDYTSEEFKAQFPQESDYDNYVVMDNNAAAQHYLDNVMDERVKNRMEFEDVDEKYYGMTYQSEKEKFHQEFSPKSWNSNWGYHFRKDYMVEVKV